MSKLITPETFDKMKAELAQMKKDGRNEIAERIRLAKSFGDLSENAEYKEALEAQSQLEQKIIKYEQILREASIVKPSKNKIKIDIGSSFEVQDQQTKRKLRLTMVGFGEANPLEGKISPESPLGKLLFGQKAGEIVEGLVNGRPVKYKIIKLF